jgi:RimJ/RimL family protein N-acetyltransferase
MGTLFTPRLELVPVTLHLVEAVYRGDRDAVEHAAGARLPEAWPGKALVERAFTVSLDAIRADPPKRLWGDRLMILRDSLPRRLVGSVVFHGQPGDDGIAEIGYGVEQDSQCNGYATEGVRASIEWALAQPGCCAVRATTFPWHRPSLRVIEKSGMTKVDSREHEVLGELLVFEIRP